MALCASTPAAAIIMNEESISPSRLAEHAMTVGKRRITIRLSADADPVDASGRADDTRMQLFAEILIAGPLSRTQLAQRTRLSQSTVTKVVNPLIDAGLVVETGEQTGGLGRPQRLLALAAQRHAVIGVKIGPALVTGIMTDLSAQVLARRERQLTAGHHPSAALAAAAAVVWDLLASDQTAVDRLIGVGIGIGGHIDGHAGRVVRSGIMDWQDVEVAGPLGVATGLPTIVGNDVDALAVAERWFGGGRDTDTFALVTAGPGIGCGLFVGGDLFTGADGLAGELGHIPVRPDGELCACGNRGCLETVASDAAILRMVAENGGPRLTSIEAAVELARSGDGAARAAFTTMGTELGRALASLCNLVNPARIVIAGERAEAFDLFGAACERAWQTHSFSTAASRCELTVHVTDDAQWARGAACLVIREAVMQQSRDAVRGQVG
jgi:predicted NBD/HSP70 family sugar kinase